MLRHRWAFKALVGLLSASLFTAVLVGCPGDEPAPDRTPDDMGGCPQLCLTTDRRCQDDTSYLSCEADAQGCYAFRNPTPCEGELVCRGGACVPDTGPSQCSDECDFDSPPRCSPEGLVQSCGDFNSDGCFAYGDDQPCDGEEVCNLATGACELVTCPAPCSPGTSRCEGELITTCREGADGCAIYSPGKDCPPGLACVDNDCAPVVSCEPECVRGERLCSPDGLPRVCQLVDGCDAYVTEAACGAAQECRRGACVSVTSCVDACVAGQEQCSGNQRVVCRDTDGDGCVELDLPQDCPNPAETCDSSGASAVCTAPPAMGMILINEVFYDALGADVAPNGDSANFIELRGPAGLSLAGYAVRLINGNGGLPYGEFTLPAGALLDGRGFAVVTMTQPDRIFDFLGTNVYPIMTAYASGQDALQNGPDSVQLITPQGAIADGLAYGTFGTNEVAAGRGTPAPGVYRGRTLGRLPGRADTQDNAADFVSLFPTPGQPNSDLRLSEVYFDQPGADGVIGQMETFVEIAAPIQGWVDVELEGYVLRAINGANDQEYLFTGVVPGIILSTSTPHGLIGDEGYRVICNIDGSDALLSVCDIPYEGVDLQNGPDSFALEYRGRVVDAIAYGSFGAGDFARGEGAPAPFGRFDAGKSLSRWPMNDPSRAQDSDDNATDFHRVAPTPGRDNARP